MKLYLDTSSATTHIELGEQSYDWESGRSLARDLLKYLHDRLVEQGKDWQDISEIHCFTGPGSFTGLRIGACVANMLADQLNVPLFDQNGEKKALILPEYGRPANISQPKK